MQYESFDFSEDFIFEKWRLGAAFKDGWTKNFEKFLEYLNKIIALDSFAKIQFYTRETACGPKTVFLRCDKVGLLGLRGISPTLNNGQISWKINATFS